MKFAQTLATIFETFGKAKAEPIRLDEFPDGVDCIEAILVGNCYQSAFNQGLFSQDDEERTKTIFRNQRLKHGGNIFSEERINATIGCLKQACDEFSTILKNTDHAKTKTKLAEVPEIWQR